MLPANHPTQHISPVLHFMVFFYSSLHQGSYDPISIKVPTNCHGKKLNHASKQTTKTLLNWNFHFNWSLFTTFLPPHPNRSQATQVLSKLACGTFAKSFSRVFACISPLPNLTMRIITAFASTILWCGRASLVRWKLSKLWHVESWALKIPTKTLKTWRFPEGS